MHALCGHCSQTHVMHVYTRCAYIASVCARVCACTPTLGGRGKERDYRDRMGDGDQVTFNLYRCPNQSQGWYWLSLTS